jgi:hypothetical protein
VSQEQRNAIILAAKLKALHIQYLEFQKEYNEVYKEISRSISTDFVREEIFFLLDDESDLNSAASTMQLFAETGGI